MAALKKCPKGKVPRIKTREPRGAMVGYKIIQCDCDCNIIRRAYHAGGDAWKKAEEEAITQWNQLMEGAGND